MLKRVLFVVFGIVLCTVLAFIPQSHVVAQTLEGGYKIFRPSGSGPHPAVVFLGGCSGYTPYFAPKHYEQVAEKFRTKGYPVVFADYLARLGKPNCMGVDILDAAGVLLETATWLKSQPSIDPAWITAIGWSFGGGAILAAVNKFSTEQLIFSRAIVYYPACGGLWEEWKPKVPVLMFLGDADRVIPLAACQEAAQKIANPDLVKAVVYPDALHCFDMSELPPMTYYDSGTIGYHPQAAAAAWEEIDRFLQSAR
jgi:dienelactone hydrolase